MLANGFVRVSLSVRQHRPRTLFAFGKQCPEIMSLQHTPCAVLPRPVLCSAPYQICFDLIFFAFSFGFVFVFIVIVFVVAFFCRRTVVSSFRFNKRRFRLPVCRRRRIYTRLLSGRHQGNQGSQQPAATPSPFCSPLCRVIAGRVASRLLRLRIYWQYNF